MNLMPKVGLILILVTHLMSLFFQIENWPFTRYPMYSKYQTVEGVTVFRVYSSNPIGEVKAELDFKYVARRKFSANFRRALKHGRVDVATQEIGKVEKSYYADRGDDDACLLVVRLKGWPVNRNVVYHSCQTQEGVQVKRSMVVN